MRLFWGLLILSFSVTLYGKTNKKLYLSVNFNNCTLCNLSIKAYLSGWDQRLPIIFIADEGSLSNAQLKEFSEVELGLKFNEYLVDSKLYQRLNSGNENSKFPVLSLEINDTLKLGFQLNELPNYLETIKRIMLHSEVIVQKVKIPRISSFPGRFDLAVEGNKLFLLSWIKNDRIYALNLKDKSLDSIYLFNNRKLVRNCLNVLGKSNLNEDEIIETFNAYPIPMKMFNFRNLQANKFGIGCALDFFFFDPNDTSEILSTEWGHFYFKKFKNENSIKLDLLSFDSIYQIHSSSLPLLPDYQTYVPINDSFLLIGLKQKPENDTIYKVKRTIGVYNINKKQLEKTGITNYIIENAIDFNGVDAINQPTILFDYFVSGNLFYTRTSPKISLNGETFNLSTLIPGISWIHNLMPIPETNLVEGYIIRNGNLQYVVADLKKTRLIWNHDLGKQDYSSNIALDNGSIFWLNKKKELVTIMFQN
ncbi:MAG: hypothetical protein LCH37_03955 [Bacteroidetes bacterium]|nr:hypothetical protein [Bacteroidota bacterium]